MSKTIALTLNNSGPDSGPYSIILYDNLNNPTIWPSTVTKLQLQSGYYMIVPNATAKVSVQSNSGKKCDEVLLTVPTTKCPCRNFTFTGGVTPTTFTFYQCGRITPSSLTIRNITVTRCIDATKPITQSVGPGSYNDTNICCTPAPTTTTTSTSTTSTTTTSTTSTSTTTTTTTLRCQCYSVKNNSANTQGISYDGCNNFSYTENISGNSTKYYCARTNTISVNTSFVTVTPLGKACAAGSSQQQSNESCIPPPTTTSSTTTTTTVFDPSVATFIISPTNFDGFIGIEVFKSLGINPVALTITGVAKRYSDTNCTTLLDQYNFNINLPANAISDFVLINAPGAAPRMRIETLIVNGVNIFQNPQNIPASPSVVYKITGFNVCKNIS